MNKLTDDNTIALFALLNPLFWIFGILCWFFFLFKYLYNISIGLYVIPYNDLKWKKDFLDKLNKNERSKKSMYIRIQDYFYSKSVNIVYNKRTRKRQ